MSQEISTFEQLWEEALKDEKLAAHLALFGLTAAGLASMRNRDARLATVERELAEERALSVLVGREVFALWRVVRAARDVVQLRSPKRLDLVEDALEKLDTFLATQGSNDEEAVGPLGPVVSQVGASVAVTREELAGVIEDMAHHWYMHTHKHEPFDDRLRTLAATLRTVQDPLANKGEG